MALEASEAGAEELLETLWRLNVEEGRPSVAPETLVTGSAGGVAGDAPSAAAALEALLGRGLVARREGRVMLSAEGLREAEHVVRRHRLAECLMADVFDMPGGLVEESACEFEHLLRRAVEERVCTLLGHPARCPHGNPIPPGECCREERRPELKTVVPLTALRPGQEGTVAYLQGGDGRRMQKLMAMGVLPGAPVRLVRRFPSFIFQMSYSRFAVDGEMAGGIFVRLAGDGGGDRAGKRACLDHPGTNVVIFRTQNF